MSQPTLDDLQQHAERMFKACAELRLLDATRGRNSDVFFGRCHTLADLGLIPKADVALLDAEVTDRVKKYYGGHHA